MKKLLAVCLSLTTVFSACVFTACDNLLAGLQKENTAPESTDSTSEPIDDKYYDKSEHLFIMFAGNSFVEFSASAYWLDEICKDNNANATVEYVWTPNGTIQDQYNDAFVDPAYLLEQAVPDVLFLQDFYTARDTSDMETFLNKMKEEDISTEVRVYPAENEADEGAAAASDYKLELVDWRKAIKTLKTSFGFTNENLNYPDTVLHANELSGVVGGVLAYMSLYGEIPNEDLLWKTVCESKGREGDEVRSFLPGQSDAEKQSYLHAIVYVCAGMYDLR